MGRRQHDGWAHIPGCASPPALPFWYWQAELAGCVPETPSNDAIRMASAVHSPTLPDALAGGPDHDRRLRGRDADPGAAARLRQRHGTIGHLLPRLDRRHPLCRAALGLGLV